MKRSHLKRSLLISGSVALGLLLATSTVSAQNPSQILKDRLIDRAVNRAWGVKPSPTPTPTPTPSPTPTNIRIEVESEDGSVETRVRQSHVSRSSNSQTEETEQTHSEIVIVSPTPSPTPEANDDNRNRPELPDTAAEIAKQRVEENSSNRNSGLGSRLYSWLTGFILR